MSPSRLPADFAALEPFVDVWGHLETAEERYIRRQESRPQDLRAFYDAMTPYIRDILTHLDRYPVDEDLPPREATVFRLALGFGEAAAAIEIYGAPRIPHVDAPHHVRIDWNDGTPR